MIWQMESHALCFSTSLWQWQVLYILCDYETLMTSRLDDVMSLTAWCPLLNLTSQSLVWSTSHHQLILTRYSPSRRCTADGHCGRLQCHFLKYVPNYCLVCVAQNLWPYHRCLLSTEHLQSLLAMPHHGSLVGTLWHTWDATLCLLSGDTLLLCISVTAVLSAKGVFWPLRHHIWNRVS